MGKLRKVNLNYKVDSWVMKCNTCGSDFEFEMIDTHISNDNKYVQCSRCGDWHKITVKPHKYDPSNRNILIMTD